MTRSQRTLLATLAVAEACVAVFMTIYGLRGASGSGMNPLGWHRSHDPAWLGFLLALTVLPVAAWVAGLAQHLTSRRLLKLLGAGLLGYLAVGVLTAGGLMAVNGRPILTGMLIGVLIAVRLGLYTLPPLILALWGLERRTRPEPQGAQR